MNQHEPLPSRLHGELHQKALYVARRHQACVSDVIDILQKLDAHRAYTSYECTSLYRYAVKHLGFSEDTALNFINVARLSSAFPRLKCEIARGAITISKARKISSVITTKNQDHWFERARTLPLKKLEQEVAEANPKAAVSDKATFVTGKRLKLEMGVSQECHDKLKRVQDLLSSSKGKAVGYEDTLETLLDFYLSKHDPLKKAQKSMARQKSRDDARPAAAPAQQPKQTSGNAMRNVPRRVIPDSIGRRKPYPAKTVHALNLRDELRCTHQNSQGERCETTRWLDIHHKIPVSRGGDNSLKNLTTLCRAHHQLHHEIEERWS